MLVVNTDMEGEGGRTGCAVFGHVEEIASLGVGVGHGDGRVVVLF